MRGYWNRTKKCKGACAGGRAAQRFARRLACGTHLLGPPAVSVVCARGRTRAVGVGRERQQQRREAVAGAVRAVGAHLCARGGRWRSQSSPGAHRSHGAHGGRAASWEQWRAGIAWGGISSRVARRRLELLEKLGDGAGAGVGGGAEAALRGAATRWPWWPDLTVGESASLHLSTRVSPGSPVGGWWAHAQVDFPLEAFPVNWIKNYYSRRTLYI